MILSASLAAIGSELYEDDANRLERLNGSERVSKEAALSLRKREGLEVLTLSNEGSNESSSDTERARGEASSSCEGVALGVAIMLSDGPSGSSSYSKRMLSSSSAHRIGGRAGKSSGTSSSLYGLGIRSGAKRRTRRWGGGSVGRASESKKLDTSLISEFDGIPGNDTEHSFQGPRHLSERLRLSLEASLTMSLTGGGGARRSTRRCGEGSVARASVSKKLDPSLISEADGIPGSDTEQSFQGPRHLSERLRLTSEDSLTMSLPEGGTAANASACWYEAEESIAEAQGEINGTRTSFSVAG